MSPPVQGFNLPKEILVVSTVHCFIVAHTILPARFNLPKEILVVSTSKRVDEATWAKIGFNLPKEILVVSTTDIATIKANVISFNLPKEILVVSTTPSRSGFVPKVPEGFNLPKEILVVSTDRFSEEYRRTTYEVSISRRRFSSFQPSTSRLHRGNIGRFQSPEGDSRRFNLRFRQALDKVERLFQSPEGDSRRFNR